MSDPDLIKISEIFLIPSSFLVAALGTADTNPHRAAISLLGFVISILWWIGTRDALRSLSKQAEGRQEHPQRTMILCTLPTVFLWGWLASAIVHGVLWNVPLGR